MLPLLDEEWQPQTTLLSPFDNLFGQPLRPGGVRRILSTGESAGRSRRAQAR